MGIDVDCWPLADVPVAGADAVIGGRAFGTDPDKVAALAGAVAEGLRDGGVLPVVKHIPGHGRAAVDSHHELPAVSADRASLEATDFRAFRLLADLPLAMTAHVVFTAIDPVTPATTSVTIVREVIRELSRKKAHSGEEVPRELSAQPGRDAFDECIHEPAVDLEERAVINAIVGACCTIGQ